MINAAIFLTTIFMPLFVKTAGPARGVAALNYNSSWSNDGALLNVDWHYGYWYQIAPNYVPMLKPATFWDGLAYLGARGYTGYLMFLNEPEIWNQDNIDPVSAANLYASLVAQLPHAKIIAPNVWWNGPGNGPRWLQAWHAEIVARGLPLPYGYAAHHYEFVLPNQPWLTADALRQQVHILWGETDAELWLPEFTSCYGGDELRGMIHQLEARPWLDRYAYFASRHNGDEWSWCPYELIGSNGELTDTGMIYRRPAGPFR